MLPLRTQRILSSASWWTAESVGPADHQRCAAGREAYADESKCDGGGGRSRARSGRLSRRSCVKKSCTSDGSTGARARRQKPLRLSTTCCSSPGSPENTGVSEHDTRTASELVEDQSISAAQNRAAQVSHCPGKTFGTVPSRSPSARMCSGSIKICKVQSSR